MYDSDEDMVEMKVRREYENLGYPVNNNEGENDEPFTRDKHGFKIDSEMYERCLETSSKSHGKFLSYEEACKANELNANRDPLDVKSDISSLYTCIHCELIFTHPKRYIIHYKWHSFGATTEAIDASSVVPKKKKKVKVEELPVDVKKEDEENKSYECDICNQIYRSKRSLHNHRSRLHMASPKSCTICDKAFSSASALASHVLNHQQQEQGNRFMCSQCPKTFKFMHSLQRHIPTHLEDKNFPCSGCDKSFGSDLLLKIHAKTHLKPMKGKGFTCSFCPKTFYQAFSMQAHARTHTGEKPFPCGLCKQKYPTNSSLSRHLKVNHEKVDDSMLIGHSVDEAPSVVKKRKQRRKRKEYSDDSA